MPKLYSDSQIILQAPVPARTQKLSPTTLLISLMSDHFGGAAVTLSYQCILLCESVKHLANGQMTQKVWDHRR